MRLNEYDSEKKEFIENNLKKLAVSLAEASPNEVSGYAGTMHSDAHRRGYYFFA